MRPSSDAAAYLWDALTAARNIRSFVTDVSMEQYVGDVLRESATERQMEIVGEALRNLRRVDPVRAERVPNVHKIIGMRNILAHGYAQVNSLTVWTAATRDVSALIPALDELLAEVDDAVSQGQSEPGGLRENSGNNP